MTAYLHIGEQTEEIILREDTVCVGIESHDGNGNNLFVIDALVNHYPCYKIMRDLPRGGTFTLICYTHSDPSMKETLERYRGIPMVEIAEESYRVTVII